MENPGKILQSLRKIVKSICACGCGKEFTGYTNKKYFNSSCRSKAKRSRDKNMMICSRHKECDLDCCHIVKHTPFEACKGDHCIQKNWIAKCV